MQDVGDRFCRPDLQLGLSLIHAAVLLLLPR